MSAINPPTSVDVSMTDESDSKQSGLYHEYDRGEIATSEVPTRPCDTKLLEVLVTDLTMIRDEWILNHEDISHQDAQDCLEAIQAECDRLHDAPELFPDATTKDQFFEIVFTLATQIMDAIALWRQKDESFQAQVELASKEELKETRPTYLEDRKPWSQFLANGALGSGTTYARAHPKTILQILPYGGIRILQSWDQESREVKDFIDNIRHRRLKPRKPLAWAHNFLGPGIDGLARNIRPVIMMPNPFARHYRREVKGRSVEKLEVLGKAMKALEGERPLVPNPHFFPVTVFWRWPRPQSQRIGDNS
ncbi:MAG: hypothetical protein M1836_007847 [Candelina mexicana]|nr:MAG: hypothetical protein M1836_007847 [Candelina mexicana]